MQTGFTFAVLATVALLGGCASLSEKDCRAGDWHAIGLRDGAAGRTEEHVAEHATACGPYGIAPDYDRWLEGRDRGLERFCTARSGYRVGEVGGTYQDVCFAGAAMEFRRGYDLGLRMNRARSRLEQIENEIRTIEGTLAARADTLTEEERKRLHYRLRGLEYERGYVRREHDDIEWRGRAL